MNSDVFADIAQHYSAIANELSSRARQAGLFNNPTDIGTEKEAICKDFWERNLPKTCNVFLGGYIFDMLGNSAAYR